MEYYKNENGDIGVLVSHGFGAGWSTWSSGIDIAIDKRVIELFLAGKDEKYVERKLEDYGYTKHYMGGWEDCELEFVPSGSLVRIDEHDGSEILIIGTDEFTKLGE